MCPARVETPDGKSFIVKDEYFLSETQGHKRIPQEDQEIVNPLSITGTPEGYTITVWNPEKNFEIVVTSTAITYTPPECEKNSPIEFGRGNMWILPGGTKISPVTSVTTHS